VKIGEILLPTDFSAAADTAASVAVAMARETGETERAGRHGSPT